VKSRPLAAVHTDAHTRLLRCTSQASTRVVTKQTRRPWFKAKGASAKLFSFSNSPYVQTWIRYVKLGYTRRDGVEMWM